MGLTPSQPPTDDDHSEDQYQMFRLIIWLKSVDKVNSPKDYDSFLRWTWAGDSTGLSATPLKSPPVFGIPAMLWTGQNKMTPEEVHQELADIKQMLLEIKAAFDRFTTDKKQCWRDEQSKAQERACKMTSQHEVIEFELSKELKEKLRGMFYETDSEFLNVFVKSEYSQIRSNKM